MTPRRVEAAGQIAASWYDEDWQYRRPITLTTSGTEPLTNYQVYVSLGAGNFGFEKARSQGQDIRFTDSDGTTVLKHWIESYASVAQRAVMFVSVPALTPAVAKTIYLYYGNPAASSTSNGNATYAMFDGFERLRNAPAPLVTPTYDGSGQTTHPGIAYFPNGWNGFEYWMVITPYPNSNDRIENPSILVSHDGLSWSVPPGLTNPLVTAPPCDHNSDADIIYNDDTDELWVYYLDARRARRCAGHENQPYYNHSYLKVMKSGDGVHWTAPQIVTDYPLATSTLNPLSPSVVKRGSTFRLWLVNVGDSGVWVSQSSDGMNFGTPTRAAVADPVWHSDIEYIPAKNEYWMVLSYPQTAGSLRFARSTDGLNWTTFVNPLLSPTTGWDTNLYRSTFLYDAPTNTFRLWYSAHRNSVWRTGYTSADYDDVLNQLTPGGLWVKEAGTGTWGATTERAKRGTTSAKLVQTGTGIGASMAMGKPQPLPNNFFQEVDLYDDMDTTAFKMMRSKNSAGNSIGIGVWTGASATRYVFHDRAYAYTATSVSRSAGWHKLGFILKADGGVTFYVDGQNVGTLTGQFTDADRVAIDGYWGGTTTFHVDDVRVRKWTAALPGVVVGAEETSL
jgi:hypothetical protein